MIAPIQKPKALAPRSRSNPIERVTAELQRGWSQRERSLRRELARVSQQWLWMVLTEHAVPRGAQAGGACE